MVEMLVGLLVVGVLLVFVGRILFFESESRRVERTKGVLSQQSDMVTQRIQRDFASAARTTGNFVFAQSGPNFRENSYTNGSEDILWAIHRSDAEGNPAAARASNVTGPQRESLTIFIADSTDLAVSAVMTGATNNIATFQIRRAEQLPVPQNISVDSPGVIRAWNAQRYMQELFRQIRAGDRNHGLFLVSSQAHQLIGVRIGDIQSVQNDNGVDVYQFSLRFPDGFNAGSVDGFANQNLLLRAARRVDYRAVAREDDPNLFELQRIESEGPGINESSLTDILSTDLEQARFDFLFASRRGENTIDTPDAAFSHPRQDSLAFAQLTYSDVVALTGRLSLARGGVFSGESKDASLGGSYEQKGDALLANRQLRAGLGAAEFNPVATAIEAGADCMPGNPASHCNPACEDIFNDASPLSPTWVGYRLEDENGELTDYCRCGGASLPNGDGFISPLTAAGVAAVPFLNFQNGVLQNPAEDALRVEACIRSPVITSNSCRAAGWQNWANRDPRWNFICGRDCLHEHLGRALGGRNNFVVNYRPSEDVSIENELDLDIHVTMGRPPSGTGWSDWVSSPPGGWTQESAWEQIMNDLASLVANNPGTRGRDRLNASPFRNLYRCQTSACRDIAMGGFGFQGQMGGELRVNSQGIPSTDNVQIGPMDELCACETREIRMDGFFGPQTSAVNFDRACSHVICPMNVGRTGDNPSNFNFRYRQTTWAPGPLVRFTGGLDWFALRNCDCRLGLPANGGLIPNNDGLDYRVFREDDVPDDWRRDPEFLVSSRTVDLQGRMCQGGSNFGDCVDTAGGEVSCVEAHCRFADNSYSCCVDRRLTGEELDTFLAQATPPFDQAAYSGYCARPTYRRCRWNNQAISGTQETRLAIFNAASMAQVPAYCGGNPGGSGGSGTPPPLDGGT